jgi:hypothetical protein
LKLNTLLINNHIITDCKSFHLHTTSNSDKNEHHIRLWLKFIQTYVDHFDINIQQLSISDKCISSDLINHLKKMQDNQKEKWRLSEAITTCQSLSEITEIIQNVDIMKSKDKKSRNLLQNAALSNRVDIMEWLVDKYGMVMNIIDSDNNTLQDLCIKAESLECLAFVKRKNAEYLIPRFCRKQYRRRCLINWLRKRIHFVVIIQKYYRRYQSYSRYGSYLKSNRGSWNRFYVIWKGVIELLNDSMQSFTHAVTWSHMKLTHDMVCVDGESKEESILQDITTTVISATSISSSDLEDVEDTDYDYDDVPIDCIITNNNNQQFSNEDDINDNNEYKFEFDCVELAQSVVKWLDSADGKYRFLFHKRLQQLVKGERSYALSKRLQHCDIPVYESKLDRGQRILWTHITRSTSTNLLVINYIQIWYY